MQLGTALLWLCLAVTVAAFAAYIASAFDTRKLPIARLAYYAMATGVVGACAYLIILLLTHDFHTLYVMSYTSTDLRKIYLVSAFWAGQEGSFLLWAFFGAVIGLILAAKSREYEPWVMAFWCTVQAFFFTLLLVKSPFAPTPPEMLARFPDGQGLRLLLQNLWMAIHPPMLFVGYAAMAVPAAYVVAGLMRKDYKTWSNRCLPWALFGWLTLGAGIILGSYWAYEVLGWGGYWGWDPVENASLVPWISATALIHGMLVERYRGSMRRTNIALALLSFLLVVYATYLTRSGVLGDFSVHSFEASGTNAYLIGFLVFFTVLSVFLYLWRGRKAPSQSWYGSLVSKEFAFFVGIISFSVLALLVLVGTSTPIITRLLLKRPIVSGQDYYGRISAPITLVVLLALTLAPLLAWARKSRAESSGTSAWLARAAAACGAALAVGGVAGLLRGLNTGVLVATGCTAALAVLVNGWSAFRYGSGNWKMLGGYVAHIGIALMLIGMVFCPSIQKPRPLVLPQGRQVQSLGYEFSFLGYTERPDSLTFRIKVERNGKSFVADPVMRPTPDGTVSAPYIRKSFLRDLYIAPVEVKAPRIEPALIAQGMQPIPATTPDGGAVVRLMKMQVETKTVILLVQENGQLPVAISLAKGQSGRVGKYHLTFDGFHMSGSHDMTSGMQVGAQIGVDYPGAVTSAVIEPSVKKLISLLWLGAILALAGGGIAIVRRVGENRKILNVPHEEDEEDQEV